MVCTAIWMVAGCKNSTAQGSADAGTPSPVASAKDPAHKTEADDEADDKADQAEARAKRKARAQARAEARQAQAAAQAGAQAQAQAALAAVCNSIQLDPSHAAAFSIAKASPSVSDPDNHACDLVIQATHPIKRLTFDWVFYDKDGVKLGNGMEILKDLNVGDKQKVTVATYSDEAVKIASKPR